MFCLLVIKKPVKAKQHIFRVQTENGKSLLLPLNIANVKSIKIVNPNSFKGKNSAPLIAQDLLTVPKPSTEGDLQDSFNNTTKTFIM